MHERPLKQLMRATAGIALPAAALIFVFFGVEEALLVAAGGSIALFSLSTYGLFCRFLSKSAALRPSTAIPLVVVKLLLTFGAIVAILCVAGGRGSLFFFIGYLAFIPASLLLAARRD